MRKESEIREQLAWNYEQMATSIRYGSNVKLSALKEERMPIIEELEAELEEKVRKEPRFYTVRVPDPEGDWASVHDREQEVPPEGCVRGHGGVTIVDAPPHVDYAKGAPNEFAPQYVIEYASKAGIVQEESAEDLDEALANFEEAKERLKGQLDPEWGFGIRLVKVIKDENVIGWEAAPHD